MFEYNHPILNVQRLIFHYDLSKDAVPNESYDHAKSGSRVVAVYKNRTTHTIRFARLGINKNVKRKHFNILV